MQLEDGRSGRRKIVRAGMNLLGIYSWRYDMNGSILWRGKRKPANATQRSLHQWLTTCSDPLQKWRSCGGKINEMQTHVFFCLVAGHSHCSWRGDVNIHRIRWQPWINIFNLYHNDIFTYISNIRVNYENTVWVIWDNLLLLRPWFRIIDTEGWEEKWN